LGHWPSVFNWARHSVRLSTTIRFVCLSVHYYQWSVIVIGPLAHWSFGFVRSLASSSINFVCHFLSSFWLNYCHWLTGLGQLIGFGCPSLHCRPSHCPSSFVIFFNNYFSITSFMPVHQLAQYWVTGSAWVTIRLGHFTNWVGSSILGHCLPSLNLRLSLVIAWVINWLGCHCLSLSGSSHCLQLIMVTFIVNVQ